MRFTRRWSLKTTTYGTWRLPVWYIGITVMEESAAFVFMNVPWRLVTAKYRLWRNFLLPSVRKFKQLFSLKRQYRWTEFHYITSLKAVIGNRAVFMSHLLQTSQCLRLTNIDSVTVYLQHCQGREIFQVSLLLSIINETA